ncbi:MAG: MFS transporter [Solirubrobacteraceae bacterium]
MSATRTRQQSERPLRGGERTTIALLGVPTLGLALATTVVTTYLPLIARRFTGSTTIIGLIIGTEGLLALVLPLVFGTWSDQLQTRLGGRLPFVLGAAPALAVVLALLGFSGSLLATILLVLAFFTAYFIAYEPYRALYPDLISREVAGRAQSIQALWRGGGTGLALVGGGLLFGLARWLPFVTASVVFVVAVAVFALVLLRRRVPDQDSHAALGLRKAVGELRRLIAEHPALRAYLVANALWELSLGAIKTFVVLFLTAGLGKSVTTAALIIGGVALVILISAPISGQLADRLGRLRILHVALWAYGLGLFVPLLTQSPYLVVPVIPAIAFGGAVVMSLPYAILIPLMPARSHGALTGFYSLSRGIGTMLGPVIAGAAVQVLRGPLSSTHGYAAIWGVSGTATLLSLGALRRLRAAESDRRELRSQAHQASDETEG